MELLVVLLKINPYCIARNVPVVAAIRVAFSAFSRGPVRR